MLSFLICSKLVLWLQRWLQYSNSQCQLEVFRKYIVHRLKNLYLYYIWNSQYLLYDTLWAKTCPHRSFNILFVKTTYRSYDPPALAKPHHICLDFKTEHRHKNSHIPRHRRGFLFPGLSQGRPHPAPKQKPEYIRTRAAASFSARGLISRGFLGSAARLLLLSLRNILRAARLADSRVPQRYERRLALLIRRSPTRARNSRKVTFNQGRSVLSACTKETAKFEFGFSTATLARLAGWVFSSNVESEISAMCFAATSFARIARCSVVQRGNLYVWREEAGGNVIKLCKWRKWKGRADLNIELCVDLSLD